MIPRTSEGLPETYLDQLRQTARPPFARVSLDLPDEQDRVRARSFYRLLRATGTPRQEAKRIVVAVGP